MKINKVNKIKIILSSLLIILLIPSLIIILQPSIFSQTPSALDVQPMWRFEGINKGMIICRYDNFPTLSDIHGPGDYDDRTMFNSLKSTILDPNSGPFKYERAAEKLYYFFRHTDREFLLTNLNTKIDSTVANSIFPFFTRERLWAKIYTDTYIKGLMGDSSAVGKMDSLAQFCPASMYRYKAVVKMSEMGVYDYFDYVREKYFGESKYLYKMIFSQYGSDPRYRDEVFEELKKEIDNSDDRMEKMRSALFLFGIDGEISKKELDELDELDRIE